MADTKLSALPSASTLTTSDLLYVDQSGTSSKATGTQIVALAATGSVVDARLSANVPLLNVNNAFTQPMTAASYSTAGSGGIYNINRRDTSANTFGIYSAGGYFQVFNYNLSGDCFLIDPSNLVTFVGSVTAPSFIGDGSGLTNLALASGQSALASGFSCTPGGGFEDVGLSVSLPSAGVYLISYNVRISMQVTGGSAHAMLCELYDATAAAAITDSQRLIFYDAVGSGTVWQLQSAYSSLVTVSVATSMKLYAEANTFGSAGTWTNSQIGSDTNGQTTLSYVQIS